MNLQKKSKSLEEKRFWRDSIRMRLQRHLESASAVALQEMQDLLAVSLCEFLKTKSGVWAGYRALPQEPDLSSVYQQMNHLTWAFPRIQGDDLHFHTTNIFEKGTYGVQEPSKDSPVVESSAIQGVLVPGLGFDKKGRRLGRGRGFYDRALSGYQGLKVGVCFECQVFEDDLPDEAHDVPMNALVTETEFRVF